MSNLLLFRKGRALQESTGVSSFKNYIGMKAKSGLISLETGF